MIVSFCAVLFPTRCLGMGQFLGVFLPTLANAKIVQVLSTDMRFANSNLQKAKVSLKMP